MDENNEIAPYIAESWKISNGGKKYTFNIAKNANFHDGKPVTSGDLAYSFDIIKKYHRFGKQMLGPIQSYEYQNKKDWCTKIIRDHSNDNEKDF